METGNEYSSEIAREWFVSVRARNLPKPGTVVQAHA
jgi:hypothetical protein